MRLARLHLARYGHLTDAELTFPADAGLHVVLGANEAGKSTALSAVADALFGFPHRSRHAFLHDLADLRIDFDVLDADGRVHGFARHKRRKDDLTDATGRPLPAAALGALLHTHTRSGFEEMFGLDSERLRRGGASILEGGGDVGRALFSAASGLTGAQAALDRLDAEADALFTKRRASGKPFYVAIDAHKNWSAERDRRAIPSRDYEQAIGELEDLRKAIGIDDQHKRTHEAERSRLERIRRTLPALRARSEAVAGLAAIGAAPDLPADAAEQVRAARGKRDTAERDLAELGQRQQALAAALAADPPNAAVLGAADTIDALAKALPRTEAAAIDRPAQAAVAAERARWIESLAARLGLAAGEPADAIIARAPSDAARGRLRRLVREHAALIATLRQGEAQEEAWRLAAEQAVRDAAAMAEVPDASALLAAVQEAREAGRIDEEIARAADDLAALRAKAARALTELAPRWPGDVAALRDTAFPARGAIRAHAKALDDATRALDEAAAGREAEARAVADAGDRLLAASAAGPLPTEQAIQAVRSRRNAVWQLIRRSGLDGGAAPTAEELDGTPATTLPDTLEQLIREADTLADRRGAEAERLALHRRALEDRAQFAAALARADDRLAAAQAAHNAAAAAWRATWAATGLDPADPAAMTEWLKARDAALDAADAVAARARDAARLAETRTHAGAALLAAAPDLAAIDARLAPLLRAAEERLRATQAAAAARVAAGVKAADTLAAHADAARALAKARDGLERWRSDWAEALAATSLMPATDPQDADSALGAWDEANDAAKAMRAARDRVTEMSAYLDGFAAEVAKIAAAAAPDLADATPLDAARALVKRLETARARLREHAQDGERLVQIDAESERRRSERAGAQAVLAGLLAAAGVDDDAALDTAVEQAARHRALTAALAASVGRLMEDGDGLPVDALAHEADGADPDAVAAEVGRIKDQLGQIDTRNSDRRQREGTLLGQIEAMQAGRDAAEAAERAMDAAAEAAEIAARYARLHVARTLLRAALSRFRAEQQDPLLRRAGALFARLTIGRHVRLETQEANDGAQRLVAVTADGRRCPADALSEGTRDQLYLALRLAALEDVAAASGSLPFLADDLLATFDDDRARAAIGVLSDMSATCQVILFTHHRHVAALVPRGAGQVQVLAPEVPQFMVGQTRERVSTVL